MNDELLIDDLNNFMVDPLPLLTAELFPSTDEYNNLNKGVDQLTVEMNTQNLKFEIESLKRRKLNQAIKQLKRESLSSRQLIVQIEEDNNIMRE